MVSKTEISVTNVTKKNNAQKVAIQHHTAYHFDRPVIIMPHLVRLRPAPHCQMPIHSYTLNVIPHQHYINWQQDPFANFMARLVFPEPASELIFDVTIVADIAEINPFDFFIEAQVDNYPFSYDGQLQQDLTPYLQIRESGPLLLNWIKSLDSSAHSTIDFLVKTTKKVQQFIEYHLRVEAGVQSCEETLLKQSGSCRDSAWLLVQIMRHLGIAARFASGYQVHYPAAHTILDNTPNSHASDLHAWAEVYLPGAGWVGLDPTSGLLAAAGYIPLACTPDPVTAAPITGSTGPCEVEFEYSNSVTLIED